MSKVRVTIATLPDAAEAVRARQRLAQAGIASFLAAGLTSGDIQVDALDAPEAREILADLAETAAELPASGVLLPPEQSEQPLSPRAVDAKRAFRAAIIGLLFIPVQLYASWMLVKVACSSGELNGRPRRLAVIAAILNVSVYVFGVLLVFSPLLNPYPYEMNPLLYAHPSAIAGIWVRVDGSGEMKLWPNGKFHYRENGEPGCEFSGTWGLGDFQFIFNVRRLTKPGHGFEQGRSYLWRLDHFNENQIVLHDTFGRWRYVRKNDGK